MKAKKKDRAPDKERCHDCNIKAGATMPYGGMYGNTVYEGRCGDCGKKTWIVPGCDYNWPDGRKAVWD